MQSESLIEITAICASQSRNYLAVGYIKQGDKKAYLCIYDIKIGGLRTKLKIDLNLFDGQPEPTQQKYVYSIAFNQGDREVAVAINGYDSKVSVYKWRFKSGTQAAKTGKLICTKVFPKQDITKISFHPLDAQILILTGPGFLDLETVNEDEMATYEFSFSGLPKPNTEYQIVDHAWTEQNNFVFVTKGGEIFTFHLFNLL